MYIAPSRTSKTPDLELEETTTPSSRRWSALRYDQLYRDRDVVTYEPFPEEKKLGVYSTGAMIVSRILGTGPFAKPGFVLTSAGSKGVALILWVLGAAMSCCGLVVYVELGIAFPFNGAEIVYLEETYRRPQYLVVIIASLLYVLVKNAAGNCIYFAKVMIRAFEPNEEPDYRIVKTVAFVMLSCVCLLHTISRRGGIILNNTLVTFKVLLFTFMILCAFSAANLQNKSQGIGKGLGPKAAWATVGEQSMNEYSKAILGVLWGYAGWNNANCFLSEVKRPPGRESSVYRRAAFGSLGLVTLLYVLINVAYFAVLSTEEIAVYGEETGERYFVKVFGANWFTERGVKVLIALSVLGNFVSTTYSLARVKQEIAKLRILPFSRLWAMQNNRYNTPSGALLLHWIVTGLTVLCVPSDSEDGPYNLVTNLSTYAECWLFILISISPILLRYSRKFRGLWNPEVFTWHYVLAIIFIYLTCNICTIVLTWWPPPVQTSKISSFATPAVATAIVVFGALYWAVFAKVLPAFGYHIDSEPDVLIDGSRTVTYKRYKTGFAKKVDDWWNKCWGSS